MSKATLSIDGLLQANPTDSDKLEWPNPLPSATTTTTLLYFLLLTWLLFRYKRQSDGAKSHGTESNLKSIPSPARMPLIGNIYMMRDYQDKPWDGFNQIRKRYGDIVSLQMGVHSMILISRPDYIKEVLLSKGSVFADRPYFPRHDIVFGGDREHSLALCSWNNTHRQRRNMCKRGVMPPKISDRNRLLERLINEHSRNLVTRLGLELVLEKSDLLFLTGDIFMEFLCSERCSHNDEAYERFNWNCDYIFHDINKSLLIDFMPYLTYLGICRSYLRELKAITDYCHKFISSRIFDPRYEMNRRIFELEGTRNQGMDIEDRHDYLDEILFEQLSQSTTMSIEDYKVGFSDLLAGHSAVSNILMKVLGHLSLDEEAQSMIYEEAKKVNLGQLDHKPSLPVAEAALLEALRIASSPIVPHVAREDTSIDGYFVPRGSAVLFNSYHLHMSEEYWSEPRKYDLRRFLVEQFDKDTNEQSYKLNRPKFFNPFSIGLRQCLGFRMVESISIAATSHLCLKYKFRADDEELVKHLLEPRGTVALDPKGRCYKLLLTPRND